MESNFIIVWGFIPYQSYEGPKGKVYQPTQAKSFGSRKEALQYLDDRYPEGAYFKVVTFKELDSMLYDYINCVRK